MIRRITSLVVAIAILAGLGAAPALAATDQPGLCSNATTTSAKDTWLQGVISANTDVDWFKFTTTSSRGVVVVLGDLPANYALALYSTCSSAGLLATSDHGSTSFEDVVMRLPAGTYRVKVWSSAGASSATPYVVRFRSWPTGVHVTSARAWVDSSFERNLHVPGEVFNNTSSNRRLVRITVRMYDAAGTLLGTAFNYAGLDVVGAGKRAPFHVAVETPLGYHHFTVSVTNSSTTTAKPVSGLRVSRGATTYDSIGLRHDYGTVTNTASTSVDSVRVFVSLHNRRGGVINANYSYTGPIDLAAGQTGTYESLFGPPNTGVNRYRVYVDGDR